jgi:hypothetical protein
MDELDICNQWVESLDFYVKKYLFSLRDICNECSGFLHMDRCALVLNSDSFEFHIWVCCSIKCANQKRFSLPYYGRLAGRCCYCRVGPVTGFAAKVPEENNRPSNVYERGYGPYSALLACCSEKCFSDVTRILLSYPASESSHISRDYDKREIRSTEHAEMEVAQSLSNQLIDRIVPYIEGKTKKEIKRRVRKEIKRRLKRRIKRRIRIRTPTH